MRALKRLASPAILFYSAHTPYHRGKWRAVNALVRGLGIEEVHRGRSWIVRRRGILWKLSVDCWVQRTVFYHGEWDGCEVAHLLADLPADGVFFDIGAYFGYYSMVAAHAKGRAAKIYAFEPVSANYERLLVNRRLNGFDNVRALRVALADTTGWAAMELPPAGNQGSGHMVEGKAGAGEEQVPLNTLDRVVAEEAVGRLDFVKLDVEGAEVAVLRGGRETLTRFRPRLLVELNPSALRSRGAEPEELLAILTELGYDSYRVAPRELTPFGVANLSSPELDKGYVNLYCVPAGAIVRSRQRA